MRRNRAVLATLAFGVCALVGVIGFAYFVARPSEPPSKNMPDSSSLGSSGVMPRPVEGDRELVSDAKSAEGGGGTGLKEPGEAVKPLESNPLDAEYTGITDKNMMGLYSTFKKSLLFEQKKIAAASKSDIERGIDRGYLETCAYLSLIQSQRLYYYGYTQPANRPPNTRDVEYHLTGAGGMCVIFELTREEFPDLFKAKDSEQEWIQSNRGNLGKQK